MPVATSPLQYRLTDMLYRMEQDTVALEELLQITDSLPSLPNVTNSKSVLFCSRLQRRLARRSVN